MDLADRKPHELATIVGYFLDRSAEGVALAEEALNQLQLRAEGNADLPIRDDNTILHTLPRAKEGRYTIPKVSKPYNQEDYDTVAEDTEGETE